MIENTEIAKKFQANLLTKRIDDIDLGRKAPQNIEMERAILSAIMLDKEAIDDVREVLTEQSFYLPSHQKIYTSALKISARNEPIDIGVLAEQLSKDGTLEMVGGPAYLIELSNTVASSANVEYHARIVAQKYIQRELIKLGNETVKSAYDNTKDVFELLDDTEKQIYELADNYTSKDPVNTSLVLNESIKELQDRINKHDKKELHGIDTGFKELNKMTGGWQNSDLVIVAGRPGMGKTAFTLAIARNAAVMANKSVAFFSLEMSTAQIMQRLISSEAEVDQQKIKEGNITGAEMTQITTRMDKLNKVNLFFDDTAGLTIMDFRKKVRKLKRDNNLDMVIIDYLQLMNANAGTDSKTKIISNREQEIAFISRSLKAIAKELNIPIIALAQLSRQTESRGGGKDKKHKPMLSDLRESGSIEQDADMVIFLYRQEYYDKDGVDEEGVSVKGKAEIIIEKHRNGETGTIPVRFIGKYVKYADNDYFDGSETVNYSSDSPFDFDSGGFKTPESTNTITLGSKMNQEDIDNAFLGDDDDF